MLPSGRDAKLHLWRPGSASRPVPLTAEALPLTRFSLMMMLWLSELNLRKSSTNSLFSAAPFSLLWPCRLLDLAAFLAPWSLRATDGLPRVPLSTSSVPLSRPSAPKRSRLWCFFLSGLSTKTTRGEIPCAPLPGLCDMMFWKHLE